MRRGLYVFGGSLVLMCVLLMGAMPSTGASEKASRSQEPLTVTVVPVGPTQAEIDSTKIAALGYAASQKKSRVEQLKIISFDLVDPGVKTAGPPAPPDRYRVIIYDYARNRAYVVAGRFKLAGMTVSETSEQPTPDYEEFLRAVEILKRDPRYGPAIRDGFVEPYPPMPPLTNGDLPNGSVERTVNVGLLPTKPGASAEIVGVNMIRQTVVTFENNAPRTAVATPTACGAPSAGQSTTSRGTAGMYEVVVNQGATELWRFTAVRPSASSGTRGSGVELINVNYRGKRVLARAHAPVLNVEYLNDACGPYRDWQWQEGWLAAGAGSDVAPGFRLCNSKPLTILDNGTDTGDFRGVALHIQGTSVMLVSEMNAGWYRYVSQWEFEGNGTIKPRFGFGGTMNSCVCNAHNHHVYWRLDFDIGTAANNVISEGSIRSGGAPLPIEFKRNRGVTGFLSYYISNVATGDVYALIPGAADQVADTYGRGDLWVLAGRAPLEYDDGHNSTGSLTEIDLDQFMNGESIRNADIVVWYGAHFLHIQSSQPGQPEVPADGTQALVGPDLVPIFW